MEMPAHIPESPHQALHWACWGHPWETQLAEVSLAAGCDIKYNK